MVQQSILPFKLEITEEEMTPRSGLAIYAEVMRAFRLRERIGKHLPKPGSNRGYQAWAYVEPVLMMLYGGGRHLEDVREIREDRALRRLIGMEKMPSISTFGDWLVRVGSDGGGAGMERVNEEVVQAVLRRDTADEYTLDVDATIIEAEKMEAQWTYKKVKGYQPILGFVKEAGLCVAHEFREGNIPAGARAVEFLERCERACPKEKRIAQVRSDSALYQAAVIDWCEGKGKKYTITADQDQAVKEALKAIKRWKKLKDGEGIDTGREVGWTIHTMDKAESSFRLIVQRWKNPQRDLFQAEEWCYYAIATNRDDEKPEEVVWFHNGRGQAENLIKELKIGFGMEQMVSGDCAGNALYFSIGVLAYNTAQAQKLFFMGEEWRNRTIATLRWKLIEIAGRVVRHGRKLILKIAAPLEKLLIFLDMRRRCYAFR